MAVILQPDDIGSLLRDLDRRIRALETSGVLNGAALREGSMVALDNLGHVVIRLGKQADGKYAMVVFDPSTGAELARFGQFASTAGVRVQNTTPQVLFQIDSANGQVAPTSVFTPVLYAGALMSGQTTSARPGTTQAAYTPLWLGRFYATGSVVNYNLSISPNAMTMDWRWMIREDPGGTLTQVAAETGQTTNHPSASTFTIPAACLVSGTDPRGRNFYYEIQAQRSAGAGATVDIGLNTQPYLTS